MGGVRTALDSAVERYGDAVVADSRVLAAALRSGADPPSEAEVAQLARVVEAGGVERLRRAAKGTVAREAAIAEVVRMVDPQVDPQVPSPVRRACTVLADALDARPAPARVERPENPSTAPLVTTPAGRLVVAVSAVVVLVAAVVIAWQGAPPASGPPVPVAGSSGPGAALPPPAAEALDGAPDDPRQAFADPALLAFAEPYLVHPGTVCASTGQPHVDVRDAVSCDLGRGWTATFSSMRTPRLVLEVRQSYLRAEVTPMPGTVRSVRWKPVPGRPGVKAGIPPDEQERGEGTRIRYRDRTGSDELYFDEERTGMWATIVAADRQPRDALRDFWADPGR